MMIEPYGSATAVDRAIKEAAGSAARLDPSISKSARIEMEHRNRFLSRVFATGEESGWILKGGTGVLARVPTARATRDIDLHVGGTSIESAIENLKMLAASNLDDYFKFVYKEHVHSQAGDNRTEMHGARVKFDTYLGVSHKGVLSVDIVVGGEFYASAATVDPHAKLELPRLVSHPYILYPIVDQIADKVAATMQVYGGRPSSREKDLVDLVTLASTQNIDGRLLMGALALEMNRRHLESSTEFSVPNHWGSKYRALASRVTHCAEYPDVQSAVTLVSALVNPALKAEVKDMAWCCNSLRWRAS